MIQKVPINDSEKCSSRWKFEILESKRCSWFFNNNEGNEINIDLLSYNSVSFDTTGSNKLLLSQVTSRQPWHGSLHGSQRWIRRSIGRNPYSSHRETSVKTRLRQMNVHSLKMHPVDFSSLCPNSFVGLRETRIRSFLWRQFLIASDDIDKKWLSSLIILLNWK